jgi:ribose transport system substrate-binding protein
MATAMSVMESILVANPNVNVVIAENDEMALGAIQAIKAAGRSGIIVIGGDGIPQGIQAVKDGTEAVDIAQQPYKMAALGVSAAFFIVNGLTISPSSLSMPLFPVTKDTVNQWIASGD